MARSTLATLITLARGLCHIGADDYTIGVTDYWSDDQVQAVLDRYRTDIFRDELGVVLSYPGAGSVEYKEYFSRHRNLEATDGGTAVLWLEDSTGANVGTANYTPDYALGRFTFSADQGGSVYYLTARSYDLNRAAADIWRQKAGHYATAVNFSTDNHRMDRGAIIQNCLTMAAQYDLWAGPTTVRMGRDDESPEGWY